jgi:UDP-N-acetylglucosamine 4,6-dehydratase
MSLKGQRVLITGGTGSFGRAFAKKVLQEDLVSAVVILSRDEWKQWEMKSSDPLFSSPKIRFFLGDIRDKERLKRAFQDVDLLVHAAALKQVPAAEYNPTEFVKTNVQGTMNVIDAALDCGVKKVIALSTDKAVNPINLYGASKLCADKLTVAGNAYVGKRGYPLFSVVRYGNVLGSRGSIIPYWQTLIKEGAKELPLTDLRMTRFWITIDQAVDFVLRSFEKMRGGEIFVPKVPSMKLVDLADAMAPSINKKIIGIREGEKLHELLISQEDASHTVEYDDHYVIAPQTLETGFSPRFGSDRESQPSLGQSFGQSLWDKFFHGRAGKLVEEGFYFASNHNARQMTQDELKKILN